MSKKLTDFWIKPSFGPSDEINGIKCGVKITKKRRLSKELNEKIETKTSDCFKSNSICLLDSMYAKNSNELAFSSYKRKELSEWFRRQFIINNFESRFLLLNGPSGSGKTTSLKVLAKEFNVEVIEYKSYNQEFEKIIDNNMSEREENYSFDLNQSENFKKFISDCMRYKRLDLVSSDVVSDTTSQMFVNRLSHRLILIEEFPNIFLLKPESLHKELRVLNRSKRLIPIVFIISDLINGHSDEYRLLPKNLQKELRMTTISFKPITNVSLSKTLQRLTNNQLSNDEIQCLIDGSSGDIRCAINNLQLVYMHSIDKKCDKSVKKSRKIKENIVLNNDYLSRDSSLTITHAIGKVLYAKRIDSQNQTNINDSNSEEYKTELPPHLNDKERVALIDNPDSIADKLMVSSDVFNAWLHQNYIEFCDSLECAQNCIQWLSECDALFSGEHHFNSKSIFESYKSSLAIRGLTFNLSDTNRQSSDANKTSNDIKSKPKREFKGFTKPQTFAVNRLANSLKREIKECLPEKRPFWNTTSLVIDIMPFVSQMPKHLQRADNQFRNVLDKVVSYERKGYPINEHELCNALSQYLAANRLDETNDEIIFQTNANEDKNRANVIQINTQAIDYNDFSIEDSDSD